MHHISLKCILGSILTMQQLSLYTCCNCLLIYVHSAGASLELLSETHWIRKKSTQNLSVCMPGFCRKMTKRILCGILTHLHDYRILVVYNNTDGRQYLVNLRCHFRKWNTRIVLKENIRTQDINYRGNSSTSTPELLIPLL